MAMDRDTNTPLAVLLNGVFEEQDLNISRAEVSIKIELNLINEARPTGESKISQVLQLI